MIDLRELGLTEELQKLKLPTPPSMLFLVLIAILLPVIRTVVSRRAHKSTRGCQPCPSLPQLDPFFGTDIVLKQLFKRHHDGVSRSRQFHQLFQDLGSTFSSSIYGSTLFVTVAPENIRAVYSTQFDEFGVGPVRGFVFGPLLGKGLMTSDGAPWKHSRALTAQTFTKPQFGGLKPFDEHVTRLLGHLPTDGTDFNLQPLFHRLALDVTTEMLFGYSVNSLSREASSEGQGFLDAFNYAQQGVGRRITLPWWNIFTTDRKFWKACKSCHDFVDKAIAHARTMHFKREPSSHGNHILVNELVERSDNLKEIREHLLNVFLPAHDAIAIPLTNIFFNLSRHPAAYLKLREEVVTLDDPAIEAEALKQLPYLNRVISETLRLFPAVTTNERVALKDTVLPTGGGPHCTDKLAVCRGDLVTMSFHSLQRRKDIWGDDAEVWRPERWEGFQPPPWTNLPFGGGPRICPGQGQGLMQVALTVVRIVKECERIECADPVPEFVDFSRVVTLSKNGCKVRLRAS
ncbi:MAG: hypothetical protein Q9217_005760 [Psora testacea]